MRISRNWLNDFVDITDLTPEAFSEIITTKVAEVDAIERAAVPVEKAVLAEITRVTPHPERPDLSLVTVFLGADSVTVVSGAPNLVEGNLVAFLPPGAQFVAAGSLVTVERREIAGIGSPGILASESELGLTSDHSGVYTVVENNLKAGQKLVGITEGPDYILIIDNKSLTHRPDLWCHYGFARELSAILGRELKLCPDRFSDDTAEGAALIAAIGSGGGGFETAIQEASGCRRFMGVELDGVTISRAPLWMRRRLFAAELGSRNVVVDLSNYVMMDVGQPNHTYDAAKLHGRVIQARRAESGEEFLGLDDVLRTLSDQDTVIADESGAVALAGIIGGGPSSITDTTRRLFVESANFDPTLVRKSSKRHQIRTDASNRFEKCPSVFNAAVGLARFVEILSRLDKGVRVVGGVVDCFPQRPSRVVIPTTFSYIRKRVGADIEPRVITNILQGLGFRMGEAKRGEVIDVTVPYWRASKDVTEPQDLVEEVGRIYGYERVPETVPLVSASVPERDAVRDFEHRLRDLLVAEGFSENYGYSTISGPFQERLGYELTSAFNLENPVDAEESFLRLSLIPGLLKTVADNAKRFEDLAIFELGRTYRKNPKVPGPGKQGEMPALEDRRLAFACRCALPESEIAEALKPALTSGGNFYVAASLVRSIARVCSPDLVAFQRFDQIAASHNSQTAIERSDFGKLLPWMHPHRSAAVTINNSVVGTISQVFPGVIADLPDTTTCVEISIPALLRAATAPEIFQPVPKFPESFFELSVVTPRNEEFSRVEQQLRSAVPSGLLRGLEVVSVYTGAPLAESEKSVSVRFRFGASDRTLASAEVKELEQGVMQTVSQGPYEIRR